MKTKLIILILVFMSPPFLRSQGISPKIKIRIQASAGGVYTRTEDPGVFSAHGEYYYAYQYSIQGAAFLPLHYFNIGLGTGLSYRYSTNLIDIYGSGLYPKVFVLLEIGNARARTPFSFIITPGIMQGPVWKKACLYIGGGPSFNIGRKFRKITASITPYIEFHGGEKKDLKYFDTRMGHPGIEHDYTLHYKTITFNLACLIQLNSFKKIKKQASK